MNDGSPITPGWHRYVLLASAAHSGIWGALIIAMPIAASKVYGFDKAPTDLHLWQGTGLFICLLAFGYWLAAANTVQHWGLVLVGLLAKVLGAIGMTYAAVSGQVSLDVLWLLPVNDVIWWFPFAVIVQHALRQSRHSVQAG